MDRSFREWSLVYAILLFLISEFPQIICQNGLPQNIETFYPFALPQMAAPTPNSTANQPNLPPPTSPMPEQPLPQPVLQTTENSSSKAAVAKAVVATAAITLVLSGLFFFLVQRYHARLRKAKGSANSQGAKPPMPQSEFDRISGNVKGLIVEEGGLDVVYWRRLQGEENKTSFSRNFSRTKYEENEEEKQMISSQSKRKNPDPRIQEGHLLHNRSSTSYSLSLPEAENKVNQNNGIALDAMEIQNSTIKPAAPPTAPLPPPRPPPPPPPPSPAALSAIPKIQSPPPPPPPIPLKRSPAPPPPPPKAGGLALSSKTTPPPVIKGMSSDNKECRSSSEEGIAGTGNGQVKLKPLHWDKINANVDHSVVWNKLDGSFRFDGDLMEALFGYVATNRKSPRADSYSPSPKGENSGSPAQVFILDTRKSQNIAIVLRSLAVSRKEIFDALNEGHGLNADTLEKLNRIAPTEEENSAILTFDGDVTRLADAESFLYHLLKAFPSAFDRFSAMLFRLNYDLEIHQLKDSLHTLEMGCKELRTRGLFFKLLEAILKAGNRMNAGTSRGNAHAFNLTALRKLSDVKSADGKTTLLHFVVEEVIRSEGKRCVLNRNQNLGRANSQKKMSRYSSSESSPNEDNEREYITLGLPVVGGLSAEFSNVKKAAVIDYDAFANTCSALTARASEIREVVKKCAPRGGGFAREMKSFLDRAEHEIKVMREEQTRVMEIVKRTTAYYQAGASKDKGAYQLQLFVIVKDFLGMVDQVCVDIARNLQRRKNSTQATGGSSPSNSLVIRSVKFPKLPANFMSDKSSDSSESGDDSR